MFTENSIVIMLLGTAAGTVITWLLLSSKNSQISAQIKYVTEENVKQTSKLEELNVENRTLLQDKSRLETELNNERQNLERIKKEMSDHFEAISSKVSQQSQKSFLELAEQTFKRLQDGAKKDQEQHGAEMKGMVEPVKENLENLKKIIGEIEKQRAGSFSELVQNITLVREDHEKLRNITTTLAQTLSSSKARGLWGERHLQKALESVGMLEGVDFVQQTSLDSSQRPDFTVHLPDKRSIIIDSKVPLDAFMEANKDGIDDHDRKRCLKRYADAVKGHIKQLGSKAYWENLDTSPEFVLMYMPSDSLYAAALEQDPQLFEEGIDNKVFLMTPSTLMPTLFVVAHAWKQEKLAQNAKEISNLGQELYKRLCTFGNHFDKLRKGLDTAVTSYDNAVGSLERSVMPAARKFRDLQAISGDDALVKPEAIGQSPRRLNLAEIENSNDDVAKAG